MSAAKPQGPQPHKLRIAVAALAALLVVLLVVLLVGSCGSGDDAGPPPPAAAAKLVPANALVYVNVSIDGDRDVTRRALKVAERFPGYGAQRDSLVKRLTAPGAKGDVRTWAGDEAALALLPGDGATAQSLVLVHIRDAEGAKRYVTGGRSAVGVSRYRGVPLYPAGSVVMAVVGDFVAVGQQIAVRQALDLRAGQGTSLAASAPYRRAVAPLPPDRAATGWATVDGIRRILAPQSGLLGIMGTLLDRQGLTAAAMALGPRDGGAKVVVHSLVDQKAAGKSGSFVPTLQTHVPADAILSLSVRGLDTALNRLLGLAGGGADLGGLLAQASTALAAKSGGSLKSGLLQLLGREAVVAITPSLPAPTLTLITKTDDEDATAKAMASLRPTVARSLAQKNAAGKRVAATWTQKPLPGGTRAWVLPFAKGAELDYAIFDGLLVVSTKVAGLRAVQAGKDDVTDTAAWKSVLGNLSKPVNSLVFLDFNQLLRLGEQTGLNDSRSYQKVRDDLRHIAAVGLTATSSAGESTAEINLQIP